MIENFNFLRCLFYDVQSSFHVYEYIWWWNFSVIQFFPLLFLYIPRWRFVSFSHSLAFVFHHFVQIKGIHEENLVNAMTINAMRYLEREQRICWSLILRRYDTHVRFRNVRLFSGARDLISLLHSFLTFVGFWIA